MKYEKRDIVTGLAMAALERNEDGNCTFCDYAGHVNTVEVRCMVGEFEWNKPYVDLSVSLKDDKFTDIFECNNNTWHVRCSYDVALELIQDETLSPDTVKELYRKAYGKATR